VAFGLDYDTYSSTASFLDYDLDGDLDIFLLNHAVHTQESFGHANLRNKKSYESGDRLLRNDGNKFIDVSDSAGIYGGLNGYGLGISVADFNQDGYPDIYIGNDFHEDDYYYLNNGDGTFTESLKEYFGHISRFSMGNDAGDINHDGYPDLISLDMLSEDEKVLKSSEGDEDFNIMRLRIERYGYHYQYSRNMLQMNSGNGAFKETALLSGVSATDWSWGALFADYDLDGNQDLFISNGIPRRPNNLDYIKFVSNDQVKNKIDETKLVDQQALDLMPSGAVHNYIFKGDGAMSFEDMSEDWLENETLFSTATAFGDLDNDGDLDLIVNNINEKASVYINQTNGKSNYLKIKFDFKTPNLLGIGTKVYAYNQGELQFKELYNVRGFQSSSEPIVHFGIGQSTTIDSLIVIWPDGTYQKTYNIPVNQTLNLSPVNPKQYVYQKKQEKRIWFKLVENNLGIDFEHREDRYVDFDRQKLMPYQISDRGPATAVGDINGDGLDDVFFGGSKYKPSQWYLQSDGEFQPEFKPGIQKDSINEEVVAYIADFSGDHKNDLLVGTGGADFFNKMKPLEDAFYIQADDGFVKEQLPIAHENTSVIAPNDFDHDGDLDVFLGSQAVSNDFGKLPDARMLVNNKGKFSALDLEEFNSLGMITDATWHDFDEDGWEDLIIVGEWMSPRFFRNNEGELEKAIVLDEEVTGLWQNITPFDIDHDGDLDYLIGNWGLNSKYKASIDSPMKMYYADFDENGSTETILTIEKEGEYYPLLGLDELSSQLIHLKKKYTSYSDFAGQPIHKIFNKDVLGKATLLEVNTLASGYLKNLDGNFEFFPFPKELQIAPIMDFATFDFDGDGLQEALAGGNYFGLKPIHGRLDAFPGAVIEDEERFIYGDELGIDFGHKSVRKLDLIHVKNLAYLLVTFNNDKSQLYSIPAVDGKSQ